MKLEKQRKSLIIVGLERLEDSVGNNKFIENTIILGEIITGIRTLERVLFLD